MLWGKKQEGRGAEEGRGAVSPGGLAGHVDDWEELAVDYVDGQLDPETKGAIDAHLQACPACAARLRAQQGVAAYLRQTTLEEPPADLEDQVLGEVLFPSTPAREARKVAADKTSHRRMVWRSRMRPWIPATAVLVALMAAVLTYGLLRSGAEFRAGSMTTTTAAARMETMHDSGAQGGLSASAQTTTTAAAAALGTSAIPSTTAGMTTTTASPKYGAQQANTQDRPEMIAGLQAAETPVYLVFGETVAGEAGTAASSEKSTEVAAQITAMTGLEPLDENLWLGGPTFAAYVPHDDAAALVDLLRSIGTTFGLPVSLSWQPPGSGLTATGADFASVLADRRNEFVELSAYPAPQPAVVNSLFTTSTLVPPGNQGNGLTATLAPDFTVTHALVVIFVQR